MSFFGQQVIHCLGNQFQYCLLIWCIKTVALKRQQFEDNKIDATKPKALKRLSVDTYDNEKRQDLDKYQDNGGRYFSFLLLQKKSNRKTNLDKRTRSINHFV